MNNVKLDQAGFATAINTIRTSEAAIRDNLNEWGVKMIEGIYAGDNIIGANQLVQSFGPIRAKRLTTILAGFLPYKKDKESGEFTSKDKNAKLAEKKLAAFEAFLAGGETLYSMLENAKKADKKPVDHGKAFITATAKALESGLTAEQLQTLFEGVVAQHKAAAIAAEIAEVQAAA